MPKKILISAVIDPDGVRYNQLIQSAIGDSLTIYPVDGELSETCFINGILFSCTNDSLSDVTNTIMTTSGGIEAKCHAVIHHHLPDLLSPTLSNAQIYDLHTASISPIKL